jgi:pentatricopeptide repeat protein
LIHLFVCLEDAKKANEVFEEMKKEGIKPNIVTFNTLIHLFVCLEDAKKANEVFEEMKKEGIKPDVVTFNSLITFFVNLQDGKRAYSLLEEMKKAEIQPDVMTINSLINYSVKAGSIEQAKVLFKEHLTIKMEGDMIDLRGMPLNVAYVTFLVYLEKEGNKKSVILITGKEYNSKDQNFLSRSHFLQSKIDDNHTDLQCRVDDSNPGRLIVEMKGIAVVVEKEKSADQDTLPPSSVQGSMQDSPNLGDGWKVYHHKKSERKVEEVPALPIREPLPLPESLETATKPVIFDRRLIPYTKQIEEAAKRNDDGACRNILDNIRAAGLKTDAYAYNYILEMYVRRHHRESAIALFEEMKKEGIQLNVLTFNIMIKLFVQLNEPTSAYAVLDEMKKAGIEPDFVTIHSLIETLEKAGSIEEAKVISKEHLTIGVKEEIKDVQETPHSARYSTSTLETWLKEKHPFSLDPFLQISESLAKIHKQGRVCHLQLEKITCLTNCWGQTDLKVSEPDLPSDPFYQAPESVKSQKSDIFSLGLIFMKLLGLSIRVKDQETKTVIPIAQMSQDGMEGYFESLKSHVAKHGRDPFLPLLVSMLQLNPDLRPQSVQAVIQALKSMRKDEKIITH